MIKKSSNQNSIVYQTLLPMIKKAMGPDDVNPTNPNVGTVPQSGKSAEIQEKILNLKEELKEFGPKALKMRLFTPIEDIERIVRNGLEKADPSILTFYPNWTIDDFQEYLNALNQMKEEILAPTGTFWTKLLLEKK